jgi:hypothetical protein
MMTHSYRKRDKRQKIITQISKNFFDSKQISVFYSDKILEQKSVNFVKDLIVEDKSTTKSLIVKIVKSKNKLPILFDEKKINIQESFDETEIRLSIDDVSKFFESYENHELNKNYRKIYLMFNSQDFLSATEMKDYFCDSLFIFDKKNVKKEYLLYIRELKENHKIENISVVLTKSKGEN